MLAKTYYRGRVKGLADRAAQQGKPRTGAVYECVRGLRGTLEQQRPVAEVKTRYGARFQSFRAVQRVLRLHHRSLHNVCL